MINDFNHSLLLLSYECANDECCRITLKKDLQRLRADKFVGGKLLQKTKTTKKELEKLVSILNQSRKIVQSPSFESEMSLPNGPSPTSIRFQFFPNVPDKL